VEVVPADVQGRLIAEYLPSLDNRCLVILQAGNVASGAFDPFEAVCQWAQAAGAWVHVDGAFGLWAAASPEKRALTQGLALADSWSADAHKTLNAPYDCGIVLCKERPALLQAMQISGAYIITSAQRDNMHYTPEMSRRARGIELWAALKALGRQGVADLVERLCGHALDFAGLLQAQGFHILNDVVFNQVLVACDTPEQTQAVLQAVQQSGECWCGGTTWQGRPAIRISVCSWATTAADIERSAAAFVQAKQGAKR
jgi:glutamate/tyrosine decarboxylase-like PLP-dependent enzyme